MTYITDGTMIAGFDVILAVIASVHNFVFSLVVQLVKHAER